MPGRPISDDLRARIVAHYKEVPDATYAGTAATFSVGEASVSRLLRQYRELGTTNHVAKPIVRRTKLDKEWLRERVRRLPDARLKDHALAFEQERGIRVSIASVWHMVVVLGFTHKKTVFAKERDSPRVAALRQKFAAEQSALDPARLVFLDESGMRLGTPTRYGWALKGCKALGKAVHGAWRMVTMIGAVALDGFRGFVNIESGTSGDVFRAFVEQQFVPNLKAGDCVVMDNLSSHKDARAVAAIHECGAKILFLPPYSPEYNPIEKVWSKLKELVRRAATDTREQFDAAVADAMDQISKADLAAWYKHCGYALTST